MHCEGVDPQAKELSLSDEEFMTVFGVTKDEFKLQPKWKKDKQKKEKGLF